MINYCIEQTLLNISFSVHRNTFFVFYFTCFYLVAGTVLAIDKSSDSLSNTKLKSEHIRLAYQYDIFNPQIRDWNTIMFQYALKNETWTILPQVIVSNRFDITTVVGELDTYKTLKNGDYINLGGAYSTEVIFPKAKLYAEYFNPFAKTWEHSVGLRYLYFDRTGNMGVLTTSLSKYYGRFLSSIRLNGAYAEKNNNFANYSVILNQRYYLNDEAYIGLTASYGYDNSLIIFTDNLNLLNGRPYLTSIGMQYQTAYKKQNKWSFNYDWTHYDFIAFDRNQHSFSIYFTHRLVPQSK